VVFRKKTPRRKKKPGRRIKGVICVLLAAFAAGWYACSHDARTAGIHNPFRPEAATAHAHESPPAAPPPTAPETQTIQAYFSPRGGTRDAIVNCIDGARSEVLVALYYLTDEGLAEALVRAHRRGVRVEAVLDRTQKTARGGQAERLANAGIPVRFDERHRIFHHKFAVIDGVTLVTGSFNWTQSAEKVNAENTLVIRNNPELAAEYARAFAVSKNGAPLAAPPSAKRR